MDNSERIGSWEKQMRTRECSQRQGSCGAGAGVDAVKVEGVGHARSWASSIEPMRMKGPGPKVKSGDEYRQ